MKFRAAAKERSSLLLAAVCLLSALVLSPAAEASRSQPAATAPVLEAPATPDQVLSAEFEDPPQRLRLFDDLLLPPRPLELVEARKTASGSSTYTLGLNVWQTGDLSQECSGLSFQGLWTDPVTGISYARNRWYDARTASWLSEDPKGAIDSPNLYAFVAWGPHQGRDPMGTCTVFDGGMAVVTTSSVPCSEVVSGAVSSLFSAGRSGVAWAGQALRSAFREPEEIGRGLGETARATALDPTIPAQIVDANVRQGIASAIYATTTAPEVMLADATNQITSTLSDPDRAGRAAFHLGLITLSAAAERASLASSSANRIVGAADDFGDLGTRSGVGGNWYRSLEGHPTDPNIPGGAGNYRGRFNAALDADGQPRLPSDWDPHHTTPQRLRNPNHPQHHLTQGIDIDHPAEVRGVMGSRARMSTDAPQGGTLLVTDPNGRIRSTNIHSELDRELSEFLLTNPTRGQLDDFLAFQDWRWGHEFWESGAGR